MARYEVTTTVVYTYDVEADSVEQAESLGWEYEDHKFNAEVDSIKVYEYEDEEEEEEE